MANEKLTTALTNSRRMTHKEIKISNCIDYFKIRVDNIIEIPNSDKDYFDFSKNGNEPGSEDYTFIHELCMILLLTPYEFFKKEKTGYPRFYVFDEDVYIYGGKDSESLNDFTPRYYLEMKGHALRQFELRCIEKGLDVFEQYCKLFDFCYKHTFSDRNLKILRIDVARDDFSNYITIKELQDKLRNGFYISKSSKIEQAFNYSKSDNIDDVNEIVSKGWTAYIGGRTSRQLCIYNKLEERKAKNNVVLNESWLRYEARFYHENSIKAFEILYFNVFRERNKEDFNKFVGSLINCIIEFKEDNNFDKGHQYEVDTWSKWIELIGYNDLDFTIQASVEKDNSMLKSKDWLIDSPYMNVTLEFLSDVKFYLDKNELIHLETECPGETYAICGIKLDDAFLKFIFALLHRGKSNLDQVKLAKVNNLRRAKGLPYIKSIYHAQKLIDQYIRNDYDFGYSHSYKYQREEEEQC